MTDYTLSDLQAADQRYREEKATLESRLRRELQDRLTATRGERDKIAYHLFTQGVSKRKIAMEGLSTKAVISAYDAIENGGRLLGVDLEEEPIVSGTFTGRRPASEPKISWASGREGQVIDVVLGLSQLTRALAADPDMESTRNGAFIVKDGDVEPRAVDMSIPAVWLFFRDEAFAKQLEEFAATAN